MTDRQHQSLFALDIAKLIIFIYENGYEMSGGEWLRTPEMAEIYASRGTGIKKSLHLRKLALDISLFKNGKYLTDSKDYKFAGEYWESLSDYNRWGGRFKDANGDPKPDGNHFERNPELHS